MLNRLFQTTSKVFIPSNKMLIQKSQVLNSYINLFKPVLTIVIVIHYKPQIAAAILDL